MTRTWRKSKTGRADELDQHSGLHANGATSSLRCKVIKLHVVSSPLLEGIRWELVRQPGIIENGMVLGKMLGRVSQLQLS